MSKRSEWDVLKQHHRFVRDDEEPSDVSWEERLARAYESKLFKEFALIDLKHYKSKKLALRWRTATEVVQGLGEDTCGSLRCRYHNPGSHDDPGSPPLLKSFELPFVYEEDGRRKETLVKVRLCGKCSKKLAWKPEDETAKRRRSASPRGEVNRRRQSRDQDERRVRDREYERGHRSRR